MLAVGLLGAACARPGGPDNLRPDSPDATARVITPLSCAPARSSETLPARIGVTASGGGRASSNTYLTADLFRDFTDVCGSCHVLADYGHFHVPDLGVFPDAMTEDVLARIASNDAGFMPPANAGGKPYRERDATEPSVKLLALLRLWFAQGKPQNQFTLPGNAEAVDGPTGQEPHDAGQSDSDGGHDGGEDGGHDAGSDGGRPAPATPPLVDYGISPQLSAALTNIGSCVPDKSIVAVNPQTMNDMDRVFEGATELPKTLAETDLVTFDSDTLARNGVISYAPAYPLWSDDAGKMRHVRVPYGKRVTFDKETQRFRIPSHTRFYKTFLKKVVDAAGNERYRKIETRLIVSRPDQTLPDGTAQQTALFGTYVWNDDETRAELWQSRLNNGLPNTFKDRLVSYYVDEPAADAIIATEPTNLDYTLQIENPGVLRHYAIPGSQRCIQCHMGSPSADFVLGFTPLQLALLPAGQGGVIEPATGDELTQLPRLIDYGVIEGMTSAADVTPLENTQAGRAPRNAYELAAQAYLVGNCSHCHNPRGYPSVKAPELRDVLNFLPGSAPDAGIFQFALDRVSPVRVRGIKQDIPLPYITPSLRDLPAANTRYPKYETCEEGRQADGWCAKAGRPLDFIDAPWRSLIYRNVDTPFDYVDDFTIFPHMPMNTPGHDCRAARIMGDWMVSIPAIRINTDKKEDDVTGNGDVAAQPYREVKPDEPGYDEAVAEARKRLDAYHAGHRYGYCPNTIDIVDPAVLYGTRQTPADVFVYDKKSPAPLPLIMPAEGVPDRGHFVATDATDPPVEWYPRGSNWPTALLAHDAVSPALQGDPVGRANLQNVIDKLRDVTVTNPRYADLMTEVPFGLWKQKPGCDLSALPRAGSFQGDARPQWMERGVDPDAPVYLQSPGAAVFANICVNCHGPAADAHGLLADEISIMTGGLARVANFRSGLFGSVGMEGGNRGRVFDANALRAAVDDLKKGDYPGLLWTYDQGTPDDYGARYLAWMALGGTQKVLPSTLLQIVASTPVLGVSRGRLEPKGSPNMLQLVQQLCTHVLFSNTNASAADLERFFGSRTIDWSTQSALIGDNGDAELWMRLCSINNRPVVRVAVPFSTGLNWASLKSTKEIQVNYRSLFWGDDYPASAPVMNHRGGIDRGIQTENLFPLCIQEPTAGSDEHRAADAFLASHPVGGAGGNVVPYCPPQLFTTTTDADTGTAIRKWQLAFRRTEAEVSFLDAEKWAVQGAINAGVAVFQYVDQLSKGSVKPQPPYNQCERLASSPAH